MMGLVSRPRRENRNVSDFVTLTCPSCGGKLQITDDIDRFACAHCGSEHVVKRGGGVVSLAPVTEGLRRVQAGVDKTASELAIKRLEKEKVDLLQKRKEALDNGKTAGITFGLVAAVASGCIVALIILQTGIHDAGWTWLLVPLLALVALVPVYRYMVAGGKRKARALDEQILTRQAYINEHLDLVNRRGE
jgi:hypothetical protein